MFGHGTFRAPTLSAPLNVWKAFGQSDGWGSFPRQKRGQFYQTAIISGKIVRQGGSGTTAVSMW